MLYLRLQLSVGTSVQVHFPSDATFGDLLAVARKEVGAAQITAVRISERAIPPCWRSVSLDEANSSLPLSELGVRNNSTLKVDVTSFSSPSHDKKITVAARKAAERADAVFGSGQRLGSLSSPAVLSPAPGRAASDVAAAASVDPLGGDICIVVDESNIEAGDVVPQARQSHRPQRAAAEAASENIREAIAQQEVVRRAEAARQLAIMEARAVSSARVRAPVKRNMPARAATNTAASPPAFKRAPSGRRGPTLTAETVGETLAAANAVGGGGPGANAAQKALRFATSLALANHRELAEATERVAAARAGAYSIVPDVNVGLATASATVSSLRVRYRVRRTWVEESVAHVPAQALAAALRLVSERGDDAARNNLKAENMALLSPRQFWAVVRYGGALLRFVAAAPRSPAMPAAVAARSHVHDGLAVDEGCEVNFEDALAALVPGVDWSFLGNRARRPSAAAAAAASSALRPRAAVAAASQTLLPTLPHHDRIIRLCQAAGWTGGDLGASASSDVVEATRFWLANTISASAASAAASAAAAAEAATADVASGDAVLVAAIDAAIGAVAGDDEGDREVWLRCTTAAAGAAAAAGGTCASSADEEEEEGVVTVVCDACGKARRLSPSADGSAAAAAEAAEADAPWTCANDGPPRLHAAGGCNAPDDEVVLLLGAGDAGMLAARACQAACLDSGLAMIAAAELPTDGEVFGADDPSKGGADTRYGAGAAALAAKLCAGGSMLRLPPLSVLLRVATPPAPNLVAALAGLRLILAAALALAACAGAGEGGVAAAAASLAAIVAAPVAEGRADVPTVAPFDVALGLLRTGVGGWRAATCVARAWRTAARAQALAEAMRDVLASGAPPAFDTDAALATLLSLRVSRPADFLRIGANELLVALVASSRSAYSVSDVTRWCANAQTAIDAAPWMARESVW